MATGPLRRTATAVCAMLGTPTFIIEPLKFLENIGVLHWASETQRTWVHVIAWFFSYWTVLLMSLLVFLPTIYPGKIDTEKEQVR